MNVADPVLGALAMNGGPTTTRLPGLGSPLLGGGMDGLCSPTDQRGAERPDPGCDSGSTERVAVRPWIPVFRDGFDQGDAEAWTWLFP